MDSPSPADRVDQFLAAPDSLRLSERERQKAAGRKAKTDAEEAQLRAAKSADRPTVEDLLADMIRVAEDPETNPFHKFRALSRGRYRLYGHFPIQFVDDEFGQFEHAKQVAGLSDQPGTRAKKAATAERSRSAHAARYLERHVLPHCRKHPELDRELADTELVLSISDTHATFLDPFTWAVFLSCCRDLRPDVVYFNGDILDGSEISRHPKVPGWTVPLQLEFDFAREMFRQVREVVGPDCRIVFGAGNHGLDRLASYLTQVAPALANLRTMRFDQLLDLGDLDVELAQGGTIASPVGTEDQLPGRILHGFYRVHHGTYLGQSPAHSELRASARSGQSGHVHRAGLAYGTAEAGRTLTWMSTPMGCSDVAGRSYMRGTSTGWQRGFGIAFLGAGGHVRHYPVIADDGYCAVEGYVYRADRVPVPDPSKLWLRDFRLGDYVA